MATDVEKLVVQLSADMKQYQREMNKAMGVTNRQARAIEARWQKSERNLNAIGGSMARGLVAPLTGVAAALTTKEVLSYADAWTRTKNSLAVAGVTGARQVAVLDSLYEVAQRNSAPMESLANVYGKAAQAQDELGASADDLVKFTDVVAVSLKVAGTSAQEASGALLQLGQLLGSARVQAEEFNSINEAARPLLVAVAHGLDAAGGSVSKLKQLVNDGAVSNKDFFAAALKGHEKVAAMAANSAQTIDQGMTRINNAFTKYIGTTDEALSVSERLTAGLNALADNFDGTADVVVKLAAVIAGALVGRAIGGMIANFGLATGAVIKLTAALRAASTMSGVAAAIGGVSAAAGPIGLIVGGTAVAAMALFASTSGEASEGAKIYADRLRELEAAAKASADGVNASAQSIQQKSINTLISGLKEAEGEVKRTAGELSRGLESLLDREWSLSLVGLSQIDGETLGKVRALHDAFRAGTLSADGLREAIAGLANANPALQRIVDGTRGYAADAVAAERATADLNAELNATPGGMFVRLKQQAAQAEAGVQAARAGVSKLINDIVQFTPLIGDAQRRATGLVSDAEMTALEDLRDKLEAGAISADEATAALQALGRANPGLARYIPDMLALIDKMRGATNEANALNAAMSRLSDGTKELADQQARAQEGAKKAGQDFMADLAKRNAMSRQQIDLEKQIETIRKEAKAAGATLSDGDLRREAEARIAAEKRRSAEGKKEKKERADEYERAREYTRASIADMELEISTLGKSAYAIEYARTRQELLNAAKAAGRKESAGLTQEIEEQARAYALVAQKLDDAGRIQQDNLDLQREFGNQAMTSISALIRGTASWNDVLGDTLDMMSQLVLKAALLGEGPLAGLMGTSGGGLISTLMGGLSGGSGGGSIGLYSRGGPVHAATGGRIAGPGTGTSDSIPAMLSNGEYVVKAAATKKYGALLEAINSGAVRHLAGGGAAASVMSIPRIPQLTAPGASMSISAPLHIDARGASMTAEQMQAAVGPMFAEHTRQLQKAVPGWVEAQRGRTATQRRT